MHTQPSSTKTRAISSMRSRFLDITTHDIQSMNDAQLIYHFITTTHEKYFIKLLDRNRIKIRTFLYMMVCNNKDEIADIEQEVIVALWQSIHTFKFKSTFSTYLYRVCSNVAHTYIRRMKHIHSVQFNEMSHGNSYPDAQDAHAHMHACDSEKIVRATIKKLKKEDRLIIYLREFEKYSLQESAEIMNCSISAIKSKLHRAKKRLAHILTKEHI